MSDVNDEALKQPKVNLRQAFINEREMANKARTALRSTTRLSVDPAELLQDGLTHQILRALGETHWDVCGVEDVRQIISDKYGHRDGPNKRRPPPPELRMYHSISWTDIRTQKRAAVVAMYFEYLGVDDERGPEIFGSRGWDAILAARDLILSPPASDAAWLELTKRSAYEHPTIRRRVDNCRQHILPRSN